MRTFGVDVGAAMISAATVGIIGCAAAKTLALRLRTDMRIFEACISMTGCEFENWKSIC